MVKIVTHWSKSSQSNKKVAWVLRDHDNQQDCGYTFNEAWELIRDCGAINAEAKKPAGIKIIHPVSTSSFIHDKGWQLPYEDATHVAFSQAALDAINKMIETDKNWKVKLHKDKFQRSQKDLLSSWKTHEKVLQCIDVAHRIQSARSILIYIGSSVWVEAVGSQIYPKDIPFTFNNLEDLFSNSLCNHLEKLDIQSGPTPFQYIDKPYAIDFLDAVKSVNTHTQVSFEVSEGTFQEKERASAVDLILVIGASFQDLHPSVPTYYISPEIGEQFSKQSISGPITLILKEIEQHFVIKGRPLCNVCGKKVTQGVGSSTIAPVTIAVCYSCRSRGAEPYGIVLTKYALEIDNFQNGQPGPYFSSVIQATLDLLGISREQFELDVRSKRDELEKNKSGTISMNGATSCVGTPLYN